MSGTSIWRPQYKGRIRSFSEAKGFGFIDCAETLRAFGRDVFIHRFQFTEAGLKVGQEVVFEVELNKQGQPQGRRVRADAEAAEQWDYSQMGGYDDYSMGNYGGYGGMYGSQGGMYGSQNYFQQGASHQQRYGGSNQSMMMAGDSGPPEQIEEMLRGCSGSSDMWEIIEQYGHTFGKKHVVTALYQLGLCRQYEKRSTEENLTKALVDRLVLFAPAELTADEASRVLWALAVLEEVGSHMDAHRFAIQLGEQAVTRFSEFNPAQMAGFVNSLSRLVRDPSEDELVGKITTEFSNYALGGTGALPRFAPHELQPWKTFLQEASAQSQSPGQGAPSQYPYMPMGGKGPYGQSGSYAGGPGMPPPWGSGPPMSKGSMMSMPPMGKGPGGPPGYPAGYAGKGDAAKDPFPVGPMGKGGKPGYDFGPGPGGKPGFPPSMASLGPGGGRRDMGSFAPNPSMQPGGKPGGGKGPGMPGMPSMGGKGPGVPSMGPGMPGMPSMGGKGPGAPSMGSPSGARPMMSPGPMSMGGMPGGPRGPAMPPRGPPSSAMARSSPQAKGGGDSP
jgi:cold shock CspA family protein